VTAASGRARALNRAGANVSFVEISSDKGHDAFLLGEPDFHRTLAGFRTAAQRTPDWIGK
jgi:homoserine O-acetyltransferase